MDRPENGEHMIPLRALIVEDSEQDVALMVRELRKAGYSPEYERVETAEGMTAALSRQDWDIILCDYVLPGFGGLSALGLLREKGLDLPFIIVSGQIGEDVAVAAMVAGAHDYIMKGNLKRLGPAIRRELDEAENRRQRRRAEEALKKSEAELRAMANRLLQLQEEERRRIARELHDEMGQQLTVLKLLLERVKQRLGGEVPPELPEAFKVVAELVNQIRDLSLNLRPGMLDDLGLLAALRWHFQDYTRKTGIVVDFRQSGLERRLPPPVVTAAYRIIQEALTNVLRHAGSDHVTVAVEADDRVLTIDVRDDGTGFEPAAVFTSSGIMGMRERASSLGGKCTIDSAPGKGTHLMVELPQDGP